MKKLGKLSIDPEKVIKNEELVNLRGGYSGEDPGKVYCFDCSTNLLVTFLNPYCSGDLLSQRQSYYPGSCYVNCMYELYLRRDLISPQKNFINYEDYCNYSIY